MKLKLVLLTIALGLAIYPTMAQKKSCADYIEYYRDGDIEKTISAIKECKSKNAFSGEELDTAEFYLQVLYAAIGNTDDFKADVLERLCMSGKFDNRREIISAYFQLSTYYLDQENYDKAILYGDKSLSFGIWNIKYSTAYKFDLLSYVASLHASVENYDKAIDYIMEIVSYITKMSDEYNAENMEHLLKVCNYYYLSENYSKAVEYGTKVLYIYGSTYGKNDLNYAGLLTDIGGIYYKAGEYSLAAKYGEEADMIRKSLENQ